MSSCVEFLRDEFVRSSEALGRILGGIGDEEFFWEPVAGCWTVHPRSEVRAASADGCGEWVIDYEVPVFQYHSRICSPVSPRCFCW